MFEYFPVTIRSPFSPITHFIIRLLEISKQGTSERIDRESNECKVTIASVDVSNCLERIRHASIFRVTRAFVAREFPTFIEQSYKTRIYFCLSVHYISLKTNGKHESGLQKKDVERECRNIVVTRFSSVSQRKTGSTC